MADDSLPIDPSPANGSGAPAPAAPSPQFVTADQLAEVVAKTVAPIQQGMQHLARQMGSLQPAQPKAPTTENGGAGFIDRFVENPDAVLGEKFDEWAKTKLAPYLNPVLAATQKAGIREAEQSVKDFYGGEAWEKEFQPRIDFYLEKLPDSQRADPEAVKGIIRLIRGDESLAEKLEEYRTTHRDAQRREREERRRAPQFASGPGLPPQRDANEVSPEAKSFIQRTAQTAERFGLKWDETAFQNSRKYAGMSIEDRMRAEGAIK